MAVVRRSGLFSFDVYGEGVDHVDAGKIGQVTGAQQALTIVQFLRKGYAVPSIPANAGREGNSF